HHPSSLHDALPISRARDPAGIRVARRPCMLAVTQRHGLEPGEAVQRLEALFAPEARLPRSAKGQFDTATRAIVVDEHLPRAQAACHAELAPAVLRPDPRHQTVGGAVGDLDGLVFGIERYGAQYRTEDLFLRQL